MTTTNLPDGLVYVINSVETSKIGRVSYTRYGLLKGDVLFLIDFVVSTPHAGDYPDVFDNIAHTFALTTDVTA